MNREKTMNRIKSLISISAFSLAVLCLPAIASAQWGNGGYNNGGYNNGTYNNGQYGNYGGDMRGIVRDLKNRTSQFQRQLDRDLDHSRINGSRREDQINSLAKQFKSAVNDLDNNGFYNTGGYGSQNDYRMQRVANLASQIDRSVGRGNMSPNSQNLWQGIRGDLQRLGAGYGGYNNNNRNNRNNGGYGNGRINRPSWWPF